MSNKMSKITIKNSWDEITLNEFNEIRNILLSDTPEEFKTVAIVGVLTGRDMFEIEKLPITIFKSLTAHLDFLNHFPEEKLYQKDVYEVNGRKYILQANIPSITTAQYIDYSNYSKETEQDMRKIIGCFLIPEGHDYNDGYDMMMVWKDMGDMIYREVQSVAFFLQRQYGAFTIITLDSLVQSQRKKMKKKSRKEWRQFKDRVHHLAHTVYSLTFSGYQK